MNLKNSTNTFVKLQSNQKKMPSIIENRQINEMSNKDKEQFLSFEMKEDYSFKVLLCINMSKHMYRYTSMLDNFVVTVYT